MRLIYTLMKKITSPTCSIDYFYSQELHKKHENSGKIGQPIRDITDKTAEIVLLLHHSFYRVFSSVLKIYFSYRVL